jgi:uncharacterized protein (DUF2132 family)
MEQINNKDPLHGVTLKTIVSELQEKYGWDKLGQLIKINCFVNDPSLSSSLKFLRKTPWAREKVEQLYIQSKKPSKDFKWIN